MEFDKNGEIETETEVRYLSLNDPFVPFKGKRKTFQSSANQGWVRNSSGIITPTTLKSPTKEFKKFTIVKTPTQPQLNST